MGNDPIKLSLQKYLNSQKPLGNSVIAEIIQLTDGQSGNHLNYRVVTSNGAFVARITKPGDLLSYANLADEFSILKLIESYTIGPKALAIDLEYYQYPVLFEEYIEGIRYDQISLGNEEMFDALIDLLTKASKIKLEQRQFPFKFTYTTYMTNFRAWDMRMEEIERTLGTSNSFSGDYRGVIQATKSHLESIDPMLRSAKREFIYNDVHPGNTFWLSQNKEARFIDWQKVSLGDPAFMAALCARRFGSLWEMDMHDFIEKVLVSYKERKSIQNFETLFRARILERAVSDMIWETWTVLKKGLPIEIQNPEESKYFNEAKKCLERLRG